MHGLVRRLSFTKVAVSGLLAYMPKNQSYEKHICTAKVDLLGIKIKSFQTNNLREEYLVQFR